MKNILPLNLNHATPLLEITDTAGRFAHLLRHVDRKQYFSITDKLTEIAAYVSRKKNLCRLKLYLTGSIPAGAYFDSSREYDDIDLIGVGGAELIASMTREIIKASEAEETPFNYGNVKFSIKREIPVYYSTKGFRRFIITAKPPVNRLAPVDLGLITINALKRKVSQCMEDTLASL